MNVFTVIIALQYFHVSVLWSIIMYGLIDYPRQPEYIDDLIKNKRWPFPPNDNLINIHNKQHISHDAL